MSLPPILRRLTPTTQNNIIIRGVKGAFLFAGCLAWIIRHAAIATLSCLFSPLLRPWAQRNVQPLEIRLQPAAEPAAEQAPEPAAEQAAEQVAVSPLLPAAMAANAAAAAALSPRPLSLPPSPPARSPSPRPVAFHNLRPEKPSSVGGAGCASSAAASSQDSAITWINLPCFTPNSKPAPAAVAPSPSSWFSFGGNLTASIAAAASAVASGAAAAASAATSAVHYALSDPRGRISMLKFRYPLLNMQRAFQQYLNQHPDFLSTLAATLSIREKAPSPTGIFNETQQDIHVYRALLALSGRDPRYTNQVNGPQIQYQDFLTHFRKALSIRPSYHDPYSKCLNVLAFAFYKDNSMSDYLASYITMALSHAGFSVPQHLSLNDLHDLMMHANKALHRANSTEQQNVVLQSFGKLQGTLGSWFDPTMTENSPWLHHITIRLTSDGAQKPMIVLRHGTPTSDGALSAATGSFVNPEYRAFLRELEAQNQRLLYTNFQTKSGADPDGQAETNRSAALSQLQSEHPNFYFLSLPMDGPLWTHASSSQAEFIASLTQMQASNGFKLPRHNTNPQPILTQEQTQQIAQYISNFFFPREGHWTITEQRQFLLLFHSALQDWFCSALNIDVMNATCKDDKDRGNISKLTTLLFRALILGRQNDPQVLQSIFFAALGPFIIKNEPIIMPGRLEVFLHLLERVAHFKPSHWETLAERHSQVTGFTTKNLRFPDQQNWLAQLPPETQSVMLQNLAERRAFRSWTVDALALSLRDAPVPNRTVTYNSSSRDLTYVMSQLHSTMKPSLAAFLQMEEPLGSIERDVRRSFGRSSLAPESTLTITYHDEPGKITKLTAKLKSTCTIELQGKSFPITLCCALTDTIQYGQTMMSDNTRTRNIEYSWKMEPMQPES